MWSIFSRDPASSFPYEIGEPVGPEDNRSIWKLHKGKKKQGGEEVSCFVCGAKDSSPGYIDAAKAAVKRLKTLRHPCILTYLDSLESDKLVYLVTEPVVPLLTWLKEDTLSPALQASAVSWGLLQVTKGLSFLNNDGGLIHYNVCATSVFVTPGGEWKLGGVEYTSQEASIIPHKLLPQLDVYNPPEKLDPSKLRTTTKWAADMWGLGCLVWETFNGLLDQSVSLKNTSKIPKLLVSTYTRLVGASPAARPNPRDLVADLRKPKQFFHNDLIETLTFLEEIQIKDAGERHKFFTQLVGRLDNIPQYVARNKVLPALLAAHEFSNVGSVVLSPLFKIGQLLGEVEYQQHVLPCVVKLFSSSDRATRLKLLQQAEELAQHMSPSTLNDQVFTHLASGFLDTNPTIRENTVKAIRFLGPKLNYHNLNVEVLKHFARLQSKDDQGGIRTNTTVCLGKVACYLHPDVRQRCLISAFLRATRDPFPPARTAGVLALAATQQFYPIQEVATKILPNLCQLTIDPDKSVRDSVFRVLKGFLSKVEKVSEDPSLKEEMEAEVKRSSSGSSQPASWAGWAVGAITSKFYKASTAPSNTPTQTKKPSPSPTPSSGALSPSTKTSTPNLGLDSSPTRAPEHTGEGGEEEEDGGWDTGEWGSLEECEETEEMSGGRETMSPMLDNAGEEAGGWGEDDDWGGSLDGHQLGSGGGGGGGFSEPAHRATAPPKALPLSRPLPPPDDVNNFFNSLSMDQSTVSSRGAISRPSATSPKTSPASGDGWDVWGDQGTATTTGLGSNRTDDLRQQREERRLQRQKEIEAKRAARAGPMKLGAKKI